MTAAYKLLAHWFKWFWWLTQIEQLGTTNICNIYSLSIKKKFRHYFVNVLKKILNNFINHLIVSSWIQNFAPNDSIHWFWFSVVSRTLLMWYSWYKNGIDIFLLNKIKTYDLKKNYLKGHSKTVQLQMDSSDKSFSILFFKELGISSSELFDVVLNILYVGRPLSHSFLKLPNGRDTFSKSLLYSLHTPQLPSWYTLDTLLLIKDRSALLRNNFSCDLQHHNN